MNSRSFTVVAYGIASVLTGLCYLGSVRSTAVWLYILPAIGIAALATFAPRKSTSLASLMSGLTCGMVWAVIVNSWSGDNLGPVARSTTVCIVGTTLVVTGLRRQDPNTSLVGQLLNLSGALFYGAANEVWKLALLAMVFQLAGYASSAQESQNRPPQKYSWRRYLLLLSLMFLSITILLAAPLQPIGLLQRDNPLQSLIITNIDVKPPWDSPRVTTTTVDEIATTTIDATTTTTSTTTPSNTTLAPNSEDVSDKKWSIDWLLVLVIGCLILLTLVFALLMRILYVYMHFTRITRRWRKQKVRHSISASWQWTNLVLRAYGFQISPSTTLEQISKGVGIEDLPEKIQRKVIQLADLCNDSAFTRNEPAFQGRLEAWDIAKSIRRDAARKARIWRRMTFRCRRVLP